MLLFGVVVVGILAALGISGFRSYLSAAKGAEGQNGAMVLARGVAECTQQKQASSGSLTLPASAPPVPSSLSQVSGRKYQSSPSDWSADAYTCANFSMTMPQYFQYEWQLDTPTSGRAIARGDIDGDRLGANQVHRRGPGPREHARVREHRTPRRRFARRARRRRAPPNRRGTCRSV